MMRLWIALSFVLVNASSFCQTKKVTYDYSNGRICAKGKVVVCPDYKEKNPCYNSTCKKIGKWIYYYQNGNVERIENYQKIKDCSSNEVKAGLWKYFDEQGAEMKQEEYQNGVLWSADISKYYLNDQMAGEIRVRSGIRDTLNYVRLDTSNLIKNGDFEYYYGPPKRLIGNGQDQIEKQIPFWFSPDHNSPDYYNPFRRLKNVPDNQIHELNESYHYIGIILYHKPTGYYSEYITGELFSRLIPNKTYCVKIRMRLSQNSGFHIDRIGVYLSDSIFSGSKFTINPNSSPQILFKQSLDNRDAWKTLCALYTASGIEKNITIGRFGDIDELNINAVNPVNQSEGEYNQSAYYLIDKVEFLRDTMNCRCYLENKNMDQAERINFDEMNSIDSLLRSKSYILNKVFFDSDKSELLPASFNELKNLLVYLGKNNNSIILSGHTDNVGSDEHNLALSLARAKAVSDWLVENGIDQSRIQIKGCGADMPIVENNSDENRAINRRVEFRIK